MDRFKKKVVSTIYDEDEDESMSDDDDEEIDPYKVAFKQMKKDPL